MQDRSILDGYHFSDYFCSYEKKAAVTKFSQIIFILDLSSFFVIIHADLT